MCGIFSLLVQIISLVFMEPQELYFGLLPKFITISLGRVVTFFMPQIVLLHIQSLNCMQLKDFFMHALLLKIHVGNSWLLFLSFTYLMCVWILRACVSWFSQGLRPAKVSLILLQLILEMSLGSPKKSPSFPWHPSPSWQLPKDFPSNILN